MHDVVSVHADYGHSIHGEYFLTFLDKSIRRALLKAKRKLRQQDEPSHRHKCPDRFKRRRASLAATSPRIGCQYRLPTLTFLETLRTMTWPALL